MSELHRYEAIASQPALDIMDEMEVTSVIEIPTETSISPGSARLGSWPKLLRKQFMAIKNLFALPTGVAHPAHKIRGAQASWNQE